MGNSLSTGSGNALSAAVTLSTTYASRAFTATTLSVGDSLSISFDTRITSPASPPVGDRVFRFGVYNSTAANVGYTGRLDTVAPATNTYDVFESNGIFNTQTASPSFSQSVTSGTNAEAALDDNVVRHVTMLLARGSAGITATLTVQEGSLAPVSISNGTPNPALAESYYTFDQFLIGFNGTAGAPGQTGGAAETFTFDNVLINYTAAAAAPEPATLATLGFVGVVLRRRRGA